MMNYPHYSNQYTSWKWLLDARSKYLQKFNVFNTNHMDLDKEVFIGVYGPTQVGKTTFVLTLLGIKSEKILPLSEALRGKRTYGKSATVTATVFKKSPDDSFYIYKDTRNKDKVSIKVEDLESLEHELKVLRDDITSGSMESIEQVIIYISNKFFYKELIDDQELAIVDLPGDDTKDGTEEEHVDNILEKYINLCKSVIIMELSSNITALSQISIDAIKGWYKNPYKFSIVVTRSISDASVNKLVLNGEISSSKDLISHYNNELSRILFGDILDSSNVPIDNDEMYSEIAIYPLELGSSLLSLEKSMDIESYNNVILWNDEILVSLRKYLKETESPEFQIKNLFSITNLIIDARESAFKKLEEQDRQLRIDIEIDNEKLNEFKRLIGTSDFAEKSGLSELVKSLKSVVELVQNIISQGIIKSDTTDIYMSNWLLNFNDKPEKLKNTKDEKYKTVNSNFNVYLLEIRSDLSEQISDLEEKINSKLNIKEEFSFKESINVVENCTEYRDVSVSTTFFTKRIKNEKEILSKVKKVKKEIVSAIEDDLNKLVEFIEKNIKMFEGVISDSELNINRLNKGIDDKNYALNSLKQKELEAENKWEAELRIGKALDSFFVKEYEIEMQRLLNRYNEASTQDEKILIVTEMNVITFQIERLVNYGTERNRGQKY